MRGLEQRHVGAVVRGVVAAASSRPGSSSGRITLWSVESGLAMVSAGSSSPRRRPVEGRGRDEAVGDGLGQAAVAQRVLQAPAQRRVAGQPADRLAALGQRGRQAVEAVDARDLLDQVGLALDVGVAPVGHPPALRALALEAEPLEDRRRLLLADALAQQPLLARGAQRAPCAAAAGAGRRRSSRPPGGRRSGRASAARPAAGRPSRARGAAASRSARRPRCAAAAASRCAGCSSRPRWRPPSAPASSCPRPRRSARP